MIKIYAQIAWVFIKNIKWTKFKISLLLNILAAGAIWFLLRTPEPVEPEIVIEEKIIEIPGKAGKLDTVFVPEPYRVAVENPVNTELLAKYESLKDSVAKKELFKEETAEREYSESYEDSIVKIDIYTKVQGRLLKQAPTYFIKPSEIKYNDTTSIIKPYIAKAKLYGHVEIGAPLNIKELKPVFKGSLLLQNKKGNIWSVAYDTDNRVWVGTTIKF